jgi:hypothetical protein
VNLVLLLSALAQMQLLCRACARSLTIHRYSPRIPLGIGERLQCMAPLMRRGCERGSQDCSAGREQVAEEGEQQKEEAYS